MIKPIILSMIISIFSSKFIFGNQNDYLERAIAAMEIGLFDESLEQLNNALKLDPKNAQIHKLKALLYEALNDNENAINSWNKCINFSENQDTIKEARIHLEYLNEF